jgi:hypothetical protein
MSSTSLVEKYKIRLMSICYPIPASGSRHDNGSRVPNRGACPILANPATAITRFCHNRGIFAHRHAAPILSRLVVIGPRYHDLRRSSWSQYIDSIVNVLDTPLNPDLQYGQTMISGHNADIEKASNAGNLVHRNTKSAQEPASRSIELA